MYHNSIRASALPLLETARPGQWLGLERRVVVQIVISRDHSVSSFLRYSVIVLRKGVEERRWYKTELLRFDLLQCCAVTMIPLSGKAVPCGEPVTYSNKRKVIHNINIQPSRYNIHILWMLFQRQPQKLHPDLQPWIPKVAWCTQHDL